MVKWERSWSVKCRHSQAAKPHSHPGRPLRVDTEVSEALVCLLWSRGGVLQQGGKSLPSRPPWVWGRSRSQPGGCGRSHPAGCCRAWCPWRRTEEEKQGILSAVFLLHKQRTKTGKQEVVCTCVVGVGHQECTYVQHKHTLKKKCVCVLHRQLSEGGHGQQFQMRAWWHCRIPFDLHLFFMTMVGVTHCCEQFSVRQPETNGES